MSYGLTNTRRGTGCRLTRGFHLLRRGPVSGCSARIEPAFVGSASYFCCSFAAHRKGGCCCIGPGGGRGQLLFSASRLLDGVTMCAGGTCSSTSPRLSFAFVGSGRAVHVSFSHKLCACGVRAGRLERLSRGPACGANSPC